MSEVGIVDFRKPQGILTWSLGLKLRTPVPLACAWATNHPAFQICPSRRWQIAPQNFQAQPKKRLKCNFPLLTNIAVLWKSVASLTNTFNSPFCLRRSALQTYSPIFFLSGTRCCCCCFNCYSYSMAPNRKIHADMFQIDYLYSLC